MILIGRGLDLTQVRRKSGDGTKAKAEGSRSEPQNEINWNGQIRESFDVQLSGYSGAEKPRLRGEGGLRGKPKRRRIE